MFTFFPAILFLVAVSEARLEIATRSPFSEGHAAGDLEEILAGVEEISVAGSPAFLTIYGSKAFPILAGQAGSKDVYHPIAAGSRAWNGKLLGFTHDGFLYPEDPSDSPSDRNRFILNYINWVSPTPENFSVLLISDGSDHPLVDFLQNNSIQATQLPLENLTDYSQLQPYDVVCVKEFFDVDKAPILRQHLYNGRGLVLALTSWAFSYYLDVDGHFGLNFPANKVSAEHGFVWRSDSGDSISNPTTPNGNFNASVDYLYGIDVPSALAQVRNFVTNGSVEAGSGNVNKSLVQYSSVLAYGFEFIPPEILLQINPYPDALNYTATDDQPIPTAELPVTTVGDKFLLDLFHAYSSFILQPQDIPAHPASSHFPGKLASNLETLQSTPVQIKFKAPSWFSAYTKQSKNVWSYVPNSANTCNKTNDAERLAYARAAPNADEEIIVNNEIPLWFSTGLYAPAGQPIKINIEPDGESYDDFQVQIGAHTDDISRHDGWSRNPRITLKKSFDDNQVTLASPYGGLIYIIVPDRAVGENEKKINLRVSGAVRAPYFKLGETSIRDWRNTIRYASGPWAEFATDKIAISVPSTSVRDMEDPEDLLLFWDQVMDAIADLAAIPRERYRQERMVADVQISAGFMHSGYPIMTFLNEGNLAINTSQLRSAGSWGHFHELGHNHQNGDWTFSGTGEVTVNLFSLYILNTVCGIPIEKTRPEMTPQVYQPTVSQYIIDGLKFEDWQSDPWLALMFYVQLQKTYGWGAFKKAFAKYHELTSHPESDQEKIDMWLVMFSSAVEENLSVMFQSWGFPVSEEATSSVAVYPEAGITILDLLHNVNVSEGGLFEDDEDEDSFTDDEDEDSFIDDDDLWYEIDLLQEGDYDDDDSGFKK